MSGWSAGEVADALLKIQTLSASVLAGIGLLVAWFIFCKYWKRGGRPKD